jgi:hypothetical protein
MCFVIRYKIKKEKKKLTEPEQDFEKIMIFASLNEK